MFSWQFKFLDEKAQHNITIGKVLGVKSFIATIMVGLEKEMNSYTKEVFKAKFNKYFSFLII